MAIELCIERRDQRDPGSSVTPFSAHRASGRIRGDLMDVTERRRAEAILRRSEAYLSEAQRLSHTGSWAAIPATGELPTGPRKCSA